MAASQRDDGIGAAAEQDRQRAREILRHPGATMALAPRTEQDRQRAREILQHLSATMALAPRTVRNIPGCLSREPITVLNPASVAPQTNRRRRGNWG